MTKKDFLNKITLGLKELPPNVVSDILFDYQDYFESKKGILSEEEAILSLGSIDTLIKHYKEEHSHLIKTKKISFTQEIPVISESFININETTSFSSETETFSKENTETIDSTMKNDSKNTETIKKISKKKKPIKDSLPKKKVTKKSFFGYLFSIPLLAITIPIGACLGISAGGLYISFILITLCVGFFIFGISLVPFALSVAGIGVLFVKSFSTIIFTDVPSFLTEFPSSIILLFSMAFFFLGLGFFFLGISYIRSTKKTIFALTNKTLNFIFKRGDLNEA